MALGNNYDNNKKNQYMPVYYSEYGAGNKDSNVDPSAIGYSFYNRMLKITISPLKVGNGNQISYDHDNAAIVWLTHSKARLLHDAIQKVLNGETSNVGVPTGVEGFVRFSDGKELGVNNYCLIINKINENGEVISGYAYEFKAKHHYHVENFNPADKSTHKKVYNHNLEVLQLLDVLKTYYMSMTGAYAYATMDGMRFNTNTSNTKMDLIMSKLGIDYKPGTTSRQSSGSSYFDRGGISSEADGRSMRSATMEDLD